MTLMMSWVHHSRDTHLNRQTDSSSPRFQIQNPSTSITINQPCLSPRPTRSIESRPTCLSQSNLPLPRTGTQPMPATSTSAAAESHQTSLPDRAPRQASVSRPLKAPTWT